MSLHSFIEVEACSETFLLPETFLLDEGIVIEYNFNFKKLVSSYKVWIKKKVHGHFVTALLSRKLSRLDSRVESENVNFFFGPGLIQ